MNNFSIQKRFMRIALEQARKGLGRVSPNPAVGCVITKNNEVVATGYHRRFGGPHAEIMALKKADRAARGATLYVTLEPCCHFGKTPPCTDEIIKAGIKEVVAAMADPNPTNNGRGFSKLHKNGIKIISGILKKEAEGLNKAFIERMRKGRPYITVKMAQSLDGKIATRTGESKWISSEASRAMVQRLRSRHDAVMVGVNTIIKDDPLLNIRRSSLAASPSRRRSQAWSHLSVRPLAVARRSYKNPVKIIVDSKLRTPTDARIFSKDSPARVIIATTTITPLKKEELLARKGAEVLRIKDNSGRVDLKSLLRRLSRMGIGSILVEGGGEITASLFDNKLVDKLILFIAPILIGGRDAVTSLEGEGIKRLKDAFRLDGMRTKRIAGDLMVECDVYWNN